MQALVSRLAVAAAATLLSTALPAHRTSAPPVQSTQPAAAQTGRVPQFENEDVRVWRSLILPNAPLPLHHHDHPRVIIALQGGTMHIVDADGTTEVHPWETGKAYWLPAMAPGKMHIDKNAGDKPIEVMVVELEHER